MHAILFLKKNEWSGWLMNPFFNSSKIPYICTPVTGTTKEEVFRQLETILAVSQDIIEWRADFFRNLGEMECVLEVSKDIKKQTNIPLLFTIRAEHEGGEKITLTEVEKVHLLVKVCEKSAVDMIDFEISN